MADPNHIVLRDHRLVFFGPCKTGNTSVRFALAEALGKEPVRLQHQDTWEHRPADWIAQHCADWLKIGFARHPFGRFASSYADQLVRRNRWGRLRLTEGVSPLMVVRRVSRIPDAEIDQHWRSLCREMAVGGQVIPDIIVRCDDMDAGWARVAHAVKGHCGLVLPKLPRRNVSGGVPLCPETQALIRQLYASDFEVFGYEGDNPRQ